MHSSAGILHAIEQRCGLVNGGERKVGWLVNYWKNHKGLGKANPVKLIATGNNLVDAEAGLKPSIMAPCLRRLRYNKATTGICSTGEGQAVANNNSRG